MSDQSRGQFDLPAEWSEARPVVIRRWDAAMGRLTLIETTLHTTVEIQQAQAERMTDLEREGRRLHDQQTSMLEANRSILTGFGSTLGQLAERQHQFSVLSALQLMASAIVVCVVVYLAYKIG